MVVNVKEEIIQKRINWFKKKKQNGYAKNKVNLVMKLETRQEYIF